MRLQFRLFSVGAVLALAAGQASAQYIRPAPHGPVYPGPNCCPQVQPYPSAVPQPMPSTVPQAPQQPGAQPQQPGAQPQQPGAQPQQADQQPGAQPQQADQQQAPSTDAFSQAPAAGTSGAEGFNPTMFGDFIGPSIRRTFSVRGSSGSSSTFSARVPLAARGAFKIAENESPRPLDRIFINYNFFNNINLPTSGFGAGRADLHREVIGFEKTFLDGNASIGMRLPFLQVDADGGFNLSNVGDLTIIGKYALINDCQTGDVLSTGVAVTVPTGSDSLPGVGPSIHPTLIQPFVGAIFNSEDWYVHGFTSVVIPTEDRDVTLLFNDVGIGYWMYKCNGNDDGFVRGLVPTLEMHVTTPLNHRGLDNNSDVVASDLLTLTGGLTTILSGGSTLGVAVGTPLTGPRPYEMEVLVQFNLRF